jgi:SAM-dependent methyltransferase
MAEPLPCPLCGSAQTAHFHTDSVREYQRCSSCDLVFVPAPFFVLPEEEKGLYDMHENDPRDMAYRQFLSRLFDPLQERLPEHACGLDFGSGPGPTLSKMFEEQGHRVRLYDPFYAPDETALSGEYDFITATEVAEHLHRPAFELERLWSLLRPAGWLGIMTRRLDPKQQFPHWHYKNDPTHVIFFSDLTFEWLANQWETTATFHGPDVVLLQKPLKNS